MATFKFTGISELNEIITKLSDVPDEVIDSILIAMGNECVKDVKEKGKEMGVYDPEWSGTHMLDSLTLGKPKRNEDGTYSVKASFKGTRRRANTTTSNSEIAFVNEFGANGKNIPARSFIEYTQATKSEEIISAGEKVFHKYLKELDL